MKAIICSSYGPPENLKLENVPKPSPKEDEVLIKVKATPVNDYDWSLVRGKPYAYRLLFGLKKPKNPIPGMEVAGVVEQLGQDSDKFKVGDRVYGDTSDFKLASFAEYMSVSEKALHKMPDTMSFEEAACISHAANLAYQGFFDVGNLMEGQKILINGGGGGVGLFGVQMAKDKKCHITGVDTGNKLERMLELGYDEVIDYRKVDFTKNGEKYDLILDCKTNRNTFSYLKSLKPGGVYVTIGGSVGKLIQVLFMKPIISLFTNKKAKIVALKANKDLAGINELFESGKLKCSIDGPYPLEKAPWAIQYFGEGKHTGKVILSLD